MKHLLTFLAAVSMAGGASAHQGHHKPATGPVAKVQADIHPGWGEVCAKWGTEAECSTAPKPHVDSRQSTLLTTEALVPRDEAMKTAQYAYGAALVAARLALAQKLITDQNLTEISSAEERANQAIFWMREAHKAKDDGLFLTRQFFFNYAVSELLRLAEGRQRDE